MAVVVNCSICPREKSKTLITGRAVCGYCPDHRAECEARFTLTLRTRADRQQYLAGVTARRGVAAGAAFAKLVMDVWEAGRGKG